MSEKRFRTNDLVKFDYSEIGEYVDENHTDRPLRNDEVCDLLNEQQFTIEQLKESVARIKEEKEHYANLYNKCRRLKLSDEAIKQAYADLNRREREKRSQGDVTYTAKMNLNEVIY